MILKYGYIQINTIYINIKILYITIDYNIL